MKNILQVISTLSSGGAERFVVDLSNKLALNNNVTVIILTSIDPQWFLLKELDRNVTVKSLNKPNGISIKALYKLYSFIKNNNIEIVHSHLSGIYYIILSAILFYKRIFFIHTIHNAAKEEAGNRIGIIIRTILFKSRLVCPVTISEQSNHSFEQLYKLEAKIIYNGRNRVNIISDESVANDIKKALFTKKTKLLINVANIQNSKNQILLAKCVNRAVSDGYDISLFIIGREAYPEIVEEIERLNCDRIFILGEKSNPIEYIALADAFCLSSLYEGMPITLIETFSVGVIPVCTPAGGIVNMVQNGYNGFLSLEVNEDSYYSTLIRFLNMKEKERETMIGNVKASYWKYSIEQCANLYQELYNNGLKRGRESVN